MARQGNTMGLLGLDPIAQPRQCGIKTEEISAMDGEHFDGINSARRDLAWQVAEDGGFPEVLFRSESGEDDLALSRVGMDGFDLAFGDDEDVVSRVARAKDDLARLKLFSDDTIELGAQVLPNGPAKDEDCGY